MSGLVFPLAVVLVVVLIIVFVKNKRVITIIALTIAGWTVGTFMGWVNRPVSAFGYRAQITDLSSMDPSSPLFQEIIELMISYGLIAALIGLLAGIALTKPDPKE